MELRQLEHFVAVADTRHFTRAAESLSISQSGLSASIRALERELGVRLLDRTTRSVALTDAGRALLCESRRTVASAAAAREAVAAARGLERRTLVVGAEQGIDLIDVPAVVARFRGGQPGVKVVVRHGGSARLLDELAGGRLDVAFVAMTSGPVPDIDVRPVTDEPMVVVSQPHHPLADVGSVPLGRLAREQFVDFHREWAARSVADRAFGALGLERRVVTEVGDAETLRALVSYGVGIALVPASVGCDLPRIGLAPGVVEDWQIAVATPAGGVDSLAVKALLDALSLPVVERARERAASTGA